MNRLLQGYLTRFMRVGNLEFVDPAGQTFRFGDGSGPLVRVRIKDRRTEWALALNAEFELGEAFMDGRVDFEAGRIYDFLDLVLSNVPSTMPTTWARMVYRWRVLTRRWRQHNHSRASRRNVAHHYDLDARLYRLFLDSDRQYSCAYFETPDADLEAAQLAKKRHLAAKLLLEPGQKLLDIGCGWGGLGLYLASIGGADVTGVTLSEEQHGIANERAAARGIADQARFLLSDYRALDTQFDRIVSVGMFEHVGVGHFDEFFAKVGQLLKPDGVMVLHSIGRFDGPGDTNAWIQKYIFPGGYIPALSEVLPAIERAGLKVTDIEILRLHYAETLKAWRERFLEHREEARELYDERFCRMWEFYLAGSETAFRHQDMMNFQIQITRNQNAVPLTRDYITRTEADLRVRERDYLRPPLRLAGE
ncbi:cyclopropane-fatty-acyl-phospholipid synthase family protein [Pseudoxanthobacter sp.]|uniref:cyclopropane-fatty-acyl-phospholipid synthase family protein n=1 Tax=Pseudoxanthobacter sp. TaxID=1925742 RepID=UPI002FE2714F